MNTKDRKKRYSLFCKLIESFDEGWRLVYEYDKTPHLIYGDTLYQSESHMIQFIGKNPGTTMTILAKILNKTPSACSQMIHKLQKKGWVEQKRNPENCREYLLDLTEQGWKIFEKHELFDQECYEEECKSLEGFSDEELHTYIRVQEALNQAFQKDIQRTEEHFGNLQ